jgi:transcriptional regulator with PAS, ATPase and Fis domain
MRTTEHDPSADRAVLTLRRMRLTVLHGPEANTVVETEGELLRIGAHARNDLVLTDAKVSRRHAEIIRTQSGVLLRDAGSTNGTWMGQAKVTEATLSGETVFRVGQTEIRFEPLDEQVDITPSEETQFEDLVGASTVMREVFSVLERIAPTELNVLVTGETGTGKELVSRAIHLRSARRDGPLVVFDCGAAPENLIESELFGHVQGAFTGAVEARPGVFEQAHGGTLFLDELGELPMSLQPKLLRVLERREIRRVGGTKVVPVDVRVVAATNRDLAFEVAAGRFRSDLFYRLAVVEVGLPALRKRLEDLPLLVQHVLETYPGSTSVRHVASDVMEVLSKWRWPGNVRELRNTILRAVPFSDGDTVTLSALPDALRVGAEHRAVIADRNLEMPASSDYREAKNELLEGFERHYLEELMKSVDGKLAKAARVAGIDRRTIQRMLRDHGLKDLIK